MSLQNLPTFLIGYDRGASAKVLIETVRFQLRQEAFEQWPILVIRAVKHEFE